MAKKPKKTPDFNVGISAEGAIKAFKKELDRLPELMYLAEIPRNSKQAYVASGLQGPVVWFFAEPDEENDGDESLFVQGFYDLAGGISQKEFVNHLTTLRSSGGITYGKHGLGARLAALRFCPGGVEWWSLKDGEMNGIKLWINDRGKPVGDYLRNDDYEKESILHPEILKAGHGTQVIFIGMKPISAKEMPSERVAKWLSARWLKHEPGIKLYAMRARQGDKGTLVEIPTQEEALEALCDYKCDVQLTDALVRTYVLKPDLENVPAGARYHYSDLYRTKDGTGEKAKPRSKFFIVYENEIYMSTESKGVSARLRNFGITHGHQRVVMLIFPSPEHYGPNDVRTRIEPLVTTDTTDINLPFRRWAKEFNDLMPEELRAFIEESAMGSEEQNMELIKGIIDDHAKRLMGNGKKRNVIRNGEEELEAVVQFGPPPHIDIDIEENGGGIIGPPPRKRRRRIITGRLDTAEHEIRKFQPPKVRWVVPEQNEELYDYSGEYHPFANRGEGELVLNQIWPNLKRWQNQVAASMPNLSEAMVEHYTRLTTTLIHVDTIMRSKLMNQPDPTPDDFRAAMLLPTCRDMALCEIIRKSGENRD